MGVLVEVAFKGNRKEFFLWEAGDAPPRASAVIVDADRGEDFGRVHAVGEAAEQRSAKVPHGLFGAPPTRPVKRLASPDEVRRNGEVRASDDEARRKAMERVKANALVMKMTDAEWQWDRKKLTFYFTAEKRVDFRTLVRELASMFRTRIELKQIGVRDEAKRLDGIGRCGRQYCSASWLPELRPVNLGVAKDQRLSLNPSQISGACGRLMCCLRYEHEFYVQSRRKYPKEGKAVRTSRGDEKVVANDIFRERVSLRGMLDGEMRTIALGQLRDEMGAAGDPLTASLESAARDTAARETETRETETRETETREIAAREVAAREIEVAPQDDMDEPIDLDGSVTEEHPIVHLVPPTAGEAGTADASGTDGERRTQRRRGRRGGRRNRPGGGSAPPAAPNATPGADDDSSGA